MKQSWPDWLAILALCLMPLLYAAPAVFYGQTFYFHDVSINYTPPNAFNTRTMLQGELPLWNPYLAGGHPVTAETELSSLYPLNLILLLPLSIATTHTWYIVIHYMLAGVFTYLLVRRGLVLGPVPSLMAGLTFTYSGTMISQLTHISLISTLAWMPLILLLYIRALDKSRILYAVGAGLVMALQISKSHPQIVLYTAGILALYTCFAAVIDFYVEKSIRQPLMMFVKLFLVFIVAAGLSAYQIFYTLELIQLSNRSGGISIDVMTVLSYPPFYLIKFLLPHFFGSFQNYTGFGNFTEIHAYAGILPLLLTIVAWLRPKNWRVWFFTTLMVISLVLSFGKFTPLYNGLQYIPIFNFFRVPARWLLLVTFCVAILAAYGTETLIGNGWLSKIGLKKSGPRRIVSAVFALIIGSLLVISGTILWDVTHIAETCTAEDFAWRPRCIFANPNIYTRYAALTEHDPEQRDYLIVEPVSTNSYETEQIRVQTGFQQRIRLAYIDMIYSAGLFLLVLALSLSLVFARWQDWITGPVFGILATALILFDILTYGGLSTNMTTDAGYFTEEPDTVQFLKQVETSEPYRVFPTISWIPDSHNVDYVLSTLHYNLPALYGIESIEGGATLPLNRHTAYMERAIGQAGGLQMLGIANAKYIITEWEISDNQDLTAIFEGKRQRIFENLRVLPRTFVVHRVEVLNDDSAILNRLADPSFDPTNTIVLEEHPTGVTVQPPTLNQLPSTSSGNDTQPELVEGVGGVDDYATPPTTPSDAEIVMHKHNQVEIDVAMAENGFLFLSDVYYPGWNAYVDGSSAHIYQANFLFRAVELSAGTHTVEFRYEPLSFRIGAIVSLLSAGVLGLVWIMNSRNREVSEKSRPT